MADMFGSPIGRRYAESDMLEQLRGELGAHEALGRIAMQPDQARLQRTQADAAEMSLQNERRMAELVQRSMRGAAPRQDISGVPGAEAVGGMAGETNLLPGQAGPQRAAVSMADQLDDFARLAMESGMVTKAQAIAKDASLIRSREQASAASQASAALNRLKQVKTVADTNAQFFGGAQDQASWERAQALYTFQTGQQSPYSGIPYSPELVESINQTAISSEKRYTLAEQEAAQLATAGYRNSRLAQHNATLGLRRQELQLKREREARIEKQGGKQLPLEPKSPEIDQAKSLLKRDFPDISNSALDLKEGAYAIAAEARTLRRQNPALSSDMALRQAYSALRADFQEQGGIGLFGKKVGGSVKFTRGGRTVSTALPAPKDLTNLIPGRYYTNAKGAVGKWTGKGFENTGRVLSLGNSRLDTGDDEEDDDE